MIILTEKQKQLHADLYEAITKIIFKHAPRLKGAFCAMMAYELIDLIDSYTAPQSAPASVADKVDAERLDFMSSRGAWIAHSKDGETCRVFIQSENDGPEPIMGWGAKDAWHDDPRKAIDAAIAAAKAKP